MATVRSRLFVLAAAGVLVAALLAVLAAGIRTTHPAPARATDAQLVRPRLRAAPPLRLGVLDPGSLPAQLRTAWRPATVGGQFDLARLRGRPVVVNFWASWCDPCRREAPLLQRAWETERGGVLFLGVNQNDARGDAMAFLRRFKITYPSVRESGDGTSRRWGVRGFPVTFFLASDGRVVAQAIGLLRPGQLKRGIATARSGSLKKS